MVENTIEEKEVMLSDKALAIINEDLVSFVETVKDLVDQLEPQIKSISKEVSPVLNKIKVGLDNDETILLVERLSANTGTLLELVSYLEAAKDLMHQLEPQLKKITAEVGPVANKIKANLDNDQTLLLVERLTANTGTLLELISLLEGLNDLRNQLEPQLKGIMKEASPIVNAIKTNLDKDETFLLIERLTANTGTLIEMVSYLEAFNDLKNQLEPQLKKIMHEASPAVNAIRTFAENDKTIELVKTLFTTLQELAQDDEFVGMIGRMQTLKTPFVQLMDCMCGSTNGDGEGAEVKTPIDSLLKLTEIAATPVVQNMVIAAAGAMHEVSEKDIKPVSPFGLLSAMRDKDVQRATGFLVYFLKKLGQGIKTT